MRDDTDAPAEITVRYLDDAAVLFDPARQALFAANLNAGIIREGLEHGLAPAEVADVLNEEAGVDRAAARRHVAETLRQWRRCCRQAEQAVAAVRRPADTEGPPLPLTPAAPASTARYRLLDTSFTVRYGDGVPHPKIHRVLRHLREENGVGRHERRLDVLCHDGGCVVAEDGRVRYTCYAATEAAPMLKAALAECALTDCAGVDAMHAAAVQRGGTCLLLPGASGSGKSCLAAGLVAEGFTLLGDDTLVLARNGRAVRPVPFGICVKESAVELLSARFPAIGALPRHSRPDGKRVRYLTPPEITVAGAGHAAAATQIVFPTYTPQGGTELVPMSPGAALQRLLECFAPLGGDLGVGDVDALIDWISSVPCFALRMSSLTEAVRLLGHFDS